jgi:NitT/TauT family transport system permease protein
MSEPVIAAAPGRRARQALSGMRTILLPASVAFATLAAWQAFTAYQHVPEVILPSPLRVWQVMVQNRDILLKHAVPTTLESAGGFLISAALGVVLAVAIAYSRALRQALYPNLVFFQLIPKIALAPLFIIWLGIGSPSRLAFATFISFFPIVIATATGLANVNRDMVRLCRALSAREWQIFAYVRFPTALPYIFGGMKVAMTLSIIGVIIGEFITAQQGLGYLIIFATAQAETAVSMAAIAVLCACGLALYGLVALMEKLAELRFGQG